MQSAFEIAVVGASDAPPEPAARAVGRLLYLVHLAVLLWWALDRSPDQRSTEGLLALIARVLRPAALALRLRRVRRLVRAADELLREGLLGESASGPDGALESSGR